MGWTRDLAEQLGGSEPALKLMLGQLLGYPLMLIHRYFFAGRSATFQHLYFFITGFLAGFWVLGFDVFHSIYAIIGTYLILRVAGGTMLSVIVSFLFNIMYLMVGYWYTQSEDYDINWTMPQCIICLRLIGLTFDCYDGGRAKSEGAAVLSKEQQAAAIQDTPSPLQMLSHSFFIGGYFVGPQFGIKKFLNFASPNYQSSLPGSPVSYALERFGLGCMFMAIHLTGSMYVPSMWPSTQEYFDTGVLTRMIILPFWCKIVLYKYISVWLMSEGVCILSGLSFSGRREDGSFDWKGCANVKLWRLETASRFGHLIEAFNINTNGWAAAYVYKRLKFLDNRTVSQAATLLFLATWHGYHLGYFVTFFNEFITMNFEKAFLSLLERSERVEGWMKMSGAQRLQKLLGWLWVFLVMPHCFIPFSLLTAERFIPAYAATFFLFYLVYLPWPVWIKLLKTLLKVRPSPVKRD